MPPMRALVTKSSRAGSEGCSIGLVRRLRRFPSIGSGWGAGAFCSRRCKPQKSASFPGSLMKIGLARRGFSSTGGAENYLRRLTDALEIAGHEPVLFCSASWPRGHWPAHRELFVVAANSPRAFADRVGQLSAHRCDRLFSLERVWQCDCYRAGDGVHRAWLERRARFEPAWRRWLRPLNPKHRQLLALEESLFRQGRRKTVVANSRMVRGGNPRRVFRCIPPGASRSCTTGCPPGAFHAADPRRAAGGSRCPLGLPDLEFVVLFAGSGWERKGLRHALAALARLPEQVHPPGCPSLASPWVPGPFLRKPAPPWSRRPQPVPGPLRDMAACYAAADVFVAPDALRSVFPTPAWRRSASGLPVLTTEANGFAEVLTPAYTVAPCWPGGDAELEQPYYGLFLERGELPDAAADLLAAGLEVRLRTVNEEYAAKRDSLRLGGPASNGCGRASGDWIANALKRPAASSISTSGRVCCRTRSFRSRCAANALVHHPAPRCASRLNDRVDVLPRRPSW